MDRSRSQKRRRTTPGRRRTSRRGPLPAALLLLLVAGLTATGSGTAYGAGHTGSSLAQIPVQSLDGSGNNLAHPEWGRAGRPYSRVAVARYADGRSAPITGPNSRAVSNRVFNDTNQNLFSERGVTQWGFTWGQFLDHTFGLRDGRSPGDPAGEARDIPFDPDDPLEEFTNTIGHIPFVRSNPSPGTGVTNPREQTNTISSYVDAFTVYGGSDERLEWLRAGPVDGNLANNSARLLLPGDYLPRRDTRGNPAAAPVVEIDGRLRGQPHRAMVAGDIRANENTALTATHTLFAREHNRIVDLLPASLSEEEKFQIARRIVIAEQQYITYQEFLPALGVHLAAYRGYNPGIDATLSNEFATVGYRAHSMIHGELELETEAGRYTQAQLDALAAEGIEFTVDGDDIEIAVPLNVTFFNPDVLPVLGLGPVLQGIGLESEYKNDEQIDNQLRSVLFQVPVPGNPGCLDGPTLPRCFRGVVDLGAIDIERGRDHGMPSYNQMRAAYGLAPKTTFRSITGEASDAFPTDPELTPGNENNDPDNQDFLSLFNFGGQPVPLGSEDAEGTATTGNRRTPLAARLRATYGSVSNLDAFTGMVAERHLPGTDMGELQQAIWRKQFEALRDGDRFFYGNDPGLRLIRDTYGIDFRRNLGDIIADNTDIARGELNDNVFLLDDVDLPSAACRISYAVTSQWDNGFEAMVDVTNLRPGAVNGWTLRFTYPSGQRTTLAWDARASQSGPGATISNATWNAALPGNGGTVRFGFNAAWDSATNPEPASFTLNNQPCSVR